MNRLTIHSYAKINLFLEVLERREDKLHNIQSVMQNVSLADTLELEKVENGFYLASDLGEIDTEKNLITKAHRTLEREIGCSCPVNISLKKVIPISAGLGGGSSDAATTLMGLNLLFDLGLSSSDLSSLSFKIGSDVPFFITGGSALVEGAGEKVNRIDGLPGECWIVLSKPPLSLVTSSVYGYYDENRVEVKSRRSAEKVIGALSGGNIREIKEDLFNRLEEVVIKRCPEIARIKAAFTAAGSKRALLSGSGPSVFSIFEKREEAEIVFAFLKIYFKETFLVSPMGTSYRIANFS